MVKRVVGSVAGIVVLLLALLVIGMRWKLSPVLTAVRRMNRAVSNPRVLRTAGSAGDQNSVICHVGRTSGRSYRTPVTAIPTTTGFLIALPYGTRADWLRNVLAAGSAMIVTDGEQLDVIDPKIVATTDVADVLPGSTRRALSVFGVGECLHLERVPTPA
ncbi:nitroreductase family deazaflavin-dependent oxidoreductase [Mycolicibacterium sp. HK-90]|uniref:nitroreductase family deazaflavin-dependent oxidoreductase n=1 Tax=Mycolicibacterium sp. HK-90 TaxID=3056937 RepID=UPI002657AD62|nr:nitroreductase family deazaflavin-dependent oxidoreductase [Mycolicibacterium sp. HK-90]WKG03255.1 nitroreductase family deazaflavin-dependent oxidoreductase [Mycolicibacterium sp. HK-90]